MAVRTTRLFGPQVIGTATTTVFTVPADKTMLLKELAVYNNAALANTVVGFIGANATGNIVWALTVASGVTSQDKSLFLVLKPGETFRLAATAASVTVSGHGALLDGSPP